MATSENLPSGIPSTATYTWCNTDIKETKIYFLWNIKKFSCLQETSNGASVKSSVFFSSEDDENLWRLDLYPRGMDKGDEQYVSLFLVNLLKDKSHEINAEFEFSIIKNEEQTGHRKSTQAHKFNFENYSYGFQDFLARDELPNLLQYDELKICCEVTVSKQFTLSGRSNSTGTCLNDSKTRTNDWQTSTGTDDLGQLLLQQTNLYDIILVAQNPWQENETVKAHKVILAARSEVFAKMFDSGPEPNSKMIYTFGENQQKSQLEIQSIDGQTLKLMVRFLYIREFPIMEEKQTMDLLVAAERFQMKDLKELCEKTLTPILTDENVVELMPFAVMYNCRHLKVQLIKFLKNN